MTESMHGSMDWILYDRDLGHEKVKCMRQIEVAKNNIMKLGAFKRLRHLMMVIPLWFL